MPSTGNPHATSGTTPAQDGERARRSAARRGGDAALRRAAWRIRRRAVDMVAIEGFGYLGQALSAAEAVRVPAPVW